MTRADEMWGRAAGELEPAKSLARVDERARQVLTGVGVAAALLTGLGLVGVDRLAGHTLARVLATVCVVAAVVAVVIALGSLLVRLPRRRVALGNVAQVEAWYRRELNRAWWTVAAGVLTVVAVLAGGTAAIVVLTTGPDDRPAVTLRLTGSGSEVTATARVAFTNLDPGDVVATELAAAGPDGGRTVLAHEASAAGAAGVVVTVDLTAKATGVVSVAVLATAPRLAQWRPGRSHYASWASLLPHTFRPPPRSQM